MARSPVIPFPKENKTVPPSAGDLAEKVRMLANANSLNVWMDSPHFQTRMVERGIDIVSVFDVLRNRRYYGFPERDENGDWT